MINRGAKNLFCVGPIRERPQEALNPVGPNLFGLHAVIEGPVVTKRGWSNEFDPTVGVAGINRGANNLFCVGPIRERPQQALNPVGPNLFGLHAVIEGPVVTKR